MPNSAHILLGILLKPIAVKCLTKTSMAQNPSSSNLVLMGHSAIKEQEIGSREYRMRIQSAPNLPAVLIQ